MKNKIRTRNSRFPETAIWNYLRYMKRWCADTLSLLAQKTEHDKSLLIVRLDEIGDYVLFRNFLKVLRESERFKYYHITLCGNEQWKELAETFDRSYVDQFIWIQLDLFWNNLRYRSNLMKILNKQVYDVVLNPIYSRRALYDDAIVRVVSSHEKIGMSGDSLQNPQWQKDIADKWYTKLITSNSSTNFEFIRAKKYFEEIIGETISISKPSINTTDVPYRFDFQEPYAVICPGGSHLSNRWNIYNFLKVAEYLFDLYNLSSVLIGSAAEQFEQNIQKEIAEFPYIKNIIGNTKLVEIVGIIQKATIIISNDTSIAHISVALDKPVVVISNGKHYGRFTEYPVTVYSKIRYAYAPEVFQIPLTFAERVEYFSVKSAIDINSVTVPQVIKMIDTLISSEKI